MVRIHCRLSGLVPGADDETGKAWFTVSEWRAEAKSRENGQLNGQEWLKHSPEKEADGWLKAATEDRVLIACGADIQRPS